MNVCKFTGKERDSETGLDYFGARYYGNTMGRWLSPDWAAKPIAVPYAGCPTQQALGIPRNWVPHPSRQGMLN